jgi:hypothetical protein
MLLFFSDTLSIKKIIFIFSSSTIMLTHNSPRTKCVYFIVLYCVLYVIDGSFILAIIVTVNFTVLLID